MLWKAIFFAFILLSSISIIPFTFAQVASFATFQSPKKQIEQGQSFYHVKCNDDLILIKKKSDGSPACVKSQTAQKLIERGWGLYVDIPTTLQANETIQSESGTMNLTNTKFSVNYTITNAKILNIRYDMPSMSLFVIIQPNNNGNLTITIPRALMDSKQIDHKTDFQFFVLSDGQESNFNEIKKTSTDRTLLIPFTQSTNKIEIIGATLI